MKGTAVRTSISSKHRLRHHGHGQRQNGRAGDGVAPTPVGRWQRSWGRSAVSDAALDDERGLRGWIRSHAKPALSVGTSFVWQLVKNKMLPVLTKNTSRILVRTAVRTGELAD